MAEHSTLASPRPAEAQPASSGSRRWLVPSLLLAAACGGGIYWYAHRGTSAGASEGPRAAGGAAAQGHGEGPGDPAGDPGQAVEVAYPKAGGMARTVTQPGSVHAFEYADLYAKVNGYLKTQAVDIGDVVKFGQVLAEIDDPELFKAVDQAKAALDQNKAKVVQAEARVKTARADRDARAAQVETAKVDVERFSAAREYRKKQLDRIRDLAKRDAVEGRLVDEDVDQYSSSLSAEHSAQASVLTARAQLLAAEATIDAAKADVEFTKASVEVTEADLAKARVYADYTKITSPYDGVVTRRNFHRGAFIHSASDGGAMPLLSVARVDLMRVVIQVPDQDVPFLDKGDPAVLRITALGGREFRGVVSRKADMETPESRLMHAEVDISNDDRKLVEGMYGDMTITLEPPSRNLTIPSSALIEHSQGGEGAVYVARDGKARRVAVRIGRDDGSHAEVLSGLTAKDPLIVRYNGSISDGSPVKVDQPDASNEAPAHAPAH